MFFDPLSEYGPGTLLLAVVAAIVLRFSDLTTRGWSEAIDACITNYRTDHVVRLKFLLITLGKPLVFSFGRLICMSAITLVGAVLCTSAHHFILSGPMLAIVLLGVVLSISVFFAPRKIFGGLRSIVEKPLSAGLKMVARRLPRIRWQ